MAILTARELSSETACYADFHVKFLLFGKIIAPFLPFDSYIPTVAVSDNESYQATLRSLTGSPCFSTASSMLLILSVISLIR